VVPSKLNAPLRVIDVPGFGNEALDPFCQSIVNNQLKQPVSTLLLVLSPFRLKKGNASVSAFDRLDTLGVGMPSPSCCRPRCRPLAAASHPRPCSHLCRPSLLMSCR